MLACRLVEMPFWSCVNEEADLWCMVGQENKNVLEIWNDRLGSLGDFFADRAA